MYPKRLERRVVVWLDGSKSSLYGDDGSVEGAVLQLVNAGVAIVGADLYFRVSFSKRRIARTNARSFRSGASVPVNICYNYSLFAQRTHDVLTIVRFLHQRKCRSRPLRRP